MKNDRVMPIKRSRVKVAVGFFWTKWWPFWPLFLDINFQFGLSLIYIKMSTDLIWPFEPIRTSKKPLKWPYLKTRFFRSASHDLTFGLITWATIYIFP